MKDDILTFHEVNIEPARKEIFFYSKIQPLQGKNNMVSFLSTKPPNTVNYTMLKEEGNVAACRVG